MTSQPSPLLPNAYTVIYIDQDTSESFTLTRTPAATFVSGSERLRDGQVAQGILSSIVVDQMLEQIEASS